MAPNTKEALVLEAANMIKGDEENKISQAGPRKYKIVYANVAQLALIHVAGFYGLYLCFTSAKIATILFAGFLASVAMVSATAGVHRLWSHRSYKATLPLQIILMALNSMAFQGTIIRWARNHRLHHKYCDTDADPNNASRGFFFSHIGWMLVKKNEIVQEKAKLIDMSDLYSNPVVMFQKKYAMYLMVLLAFAIPAFIPIYFWGETLNNSWHVAVMLRIVVNFNCISLVNSLAHSWGYKPYDKSIKPCQSMPLILLTLGEGFHNYHHVFPWDYKAAELGNNSLNLAKYFIDFFAWIGWAYDLKTVSDDMVKSRSLRTGDGSNLWGWEDEDMGKDFKDVTEILHPKAE